MSALPRLVASAPLTRGGTLSEAADAGFPESFLTAGFPEALAVLPEAGVAPEGFRAAVAFPEAGAPAPLLLFAFPPLLVMAGSYTGWSPQVRGYLR